MNTEIADLKRTLSNFKDEMSTKMAKIDTKMDNFETQMGTMQTDLKKIIELLQGIIPSNSSQNVESEKKSEEDSLGPIDK